MAKKQWVKPVVKELRAGSAEAGGSSKTKDATTGPTRS